jgi:hypothetical protein
MSQFTPDVKDAFDETLRYYKETTQLAELPFGFDAELTYENLLDVSRRAKELSMRVAELNSQLRKLRRQTLSALPEGTDTTKFIGTKVASA